MNPNTPFNSSASNLPPSEPHDADMEINPDRLFEASEAVLLAAVMVPRHRRRPGGSDLLDHFTVRELTEAANFLARLGYIRCERA